jgi:hypothetical protein
MKCPKGKHDNGGFFFNVYHLSFLYKKKYPRKIAAAAPYDSFKKGKISKFSIQ